MSNLPYILFMMTTGILAAIVLTAFAGLATGIEYLISYIIPKHDTRYLF